MIGEVSYYRGPKRVRDLWRYVLHRDGVVLESNLFWRRGPGHLGSLCMGEEQLALHVSISFAPEDPVDPELMRRVGKDFLVRYLAYCQWGEVGQLLRRAYFHGEPFPEVEAQDLAGIEERLDEWVYGIVEHRDTEHRHIHLVLDCENVVDGSVSVLSRWELQRLGELILRQLERRYRLREVACSWIVRRKEGRRGVRLATYYAKKLGREGIRYVKETIREGTKRGSWTALEAYCRSRGVEVRKEGMKLLYQYKGVYLRPRQLGREYTIEGIEGQWVHEREMAAPDSQPLHEG